jgi:hypothetical protein
LKALERRGTIRRTSGKQYTASNDGRIESAYQNGSFSILRRRGRRRSLPRRWPGPAGAVTAKDVLKKMGDKERFSYVTGLVDMLSYQSVLAGNRDRAECISNEFYKKTEQS